MALLLLIPSCSEESGGGNTTNRIPAKCALLSPEPGVDPSLVPEEFRPEGVEVVKAEKTKKRLVAAMNNPRSVNESFALYKTAAEDAGFEIVGQDNEGFEAEIYLRDGKVLGAVQIRGSRCPEATVVFLNVLET